MKVGEARQLPLRLESRTNTPVIISSITIEGPGAAAFRLGSTPTSIDSLGTETVRVTFTPPSVGAFTAALVIASNDAERPVLRVALAGEGGLPKLELAVDCQASRGCTSTVSQAPARIDFGMEPLVRAMPIDPTKLPTVVITNAGQVPLVVTNATFRGADAAAFSVAGNAQFPDGGVTLDAAAGFNLAVRFVPTSEQQASYSAELAITSDDPDAPEVTVQLVGTLKPNAPPQVCANLIRVVPPPESLAQMRSYEGSTFWAPLLVPPAGGYDFTAGRDVRPGELAVFSALSDSANAATCSTDLEDGRTGLTYQWRLVSSPPGAQPPALGGATSAQAQLRPIATGAYTLELTVTDSRMSSTTVLIRFAVAIKEDLVAQLQWEGFSGVDLDLHLVRPSAVDGGDPYTGAFSFFSAGAANKTSGDINGYARRVRDTNQGAGFDFDWGQPGASDDPVLNLDDRGTGALIENVSLNFPENDPRCATSACTYRVMVHYFNDARMHVSAPACTVDGGVGCTDGEACSCASGSRCVAEGASGSGKCYPAPAPVVRLYFFGSPTPGAVIPLDTLMPRDTLLLGAPCTMWHVADVAWPAATQIGSLPDGGTPLPVVTVVGADGTGRITTPSFARFGGRQSGGSLQCSPDSTQGAIDWYSRR